MLTWESLNMFMFARSFLDTWNSLIQNCCHDNCESRGTKTNGHSCILAFWISPKCHMTTDDVNGPVQTAFVHQICPLGRCLFLCLFHFDCLVFMLHFVNPLTKSPATSKQQPWFQMHARTHGLPGLGREERVWGEVAIIFTSGIPPVSIIAIKTGK